jgi:hypothetical protein
MSDRPSQALEHREPNACPFVALESDPERRLPTPDNEHRCFADGTPQPITKHHQRTFCLAPGFTSCPTFLAWAARSSAAPESDPPDADPWVMDSDAPPRAATDPGWNVPPPWVVAPQLKSTAGLAPPAAAAAPVAGGSKRPADAESATAVALEATQIVRERPPGAPPTLSEAVQLPVEPVAIQILPDAPAPTQPGRAPDPAAPGVAKRPPSRFVPTVLQNQPVMAPAPTPAAGNGSATSPVWDGEGEEPAEEVPAPPARDRSRVPVDAHAPAWIEPQVRPMKRPIRTKGSGEWKDRASAYPTTRGRGLRAIPPIAVGFVVLVAIGAMLFLLPTFLAGGGPAASASPTPAASGADRAPGSTRRPAATTRPRPQGTPRFYTVKEGDTLLRIARRFRVSEAAIACSSQLQNPNVLHPGEILTIPPRGYECPRRTPRPGRRQGG